MTQAQAPKAKEKDKGTDLAALFTDLQITPDENPLPSFRRTGEQTPNPFGPVLLASVDHDTPYSIHVPPDAVARSVFLINAAARKENVGVRVVVNIERDDKGAVVKGADGKAQYIVDTKGEHKGTVLVRFKANKERKKASAPRLFSIVKDKQDETRFHVRRRADKVILFTGTKDQAKAEYERLRDAAKAQNAPQAAPAPAQASA